MSKIQFVRDGALIVLALGLSACGAGKAQTELRTAIDAKQTELNQCYAAALETDRELKGTLALAVTVENKTGKVSDVSYSNEELANDGLRSCVTTTLQSIEVEEAPSANVQVEYQMVFEPTTGENS